MRSIGTKQKNLPFGQVPENVILVSHGSLINKYLGKIRIPVFASYYSYASEVIVTLNVLFMAGALYPSFYNLLRCEFSKGYIFSTGIGIIYFAHKSIHAVVETIVPKRNPAPTHIFAMFGGGIGNQWQHLKRF